MEFIISLVIAAFLGLIPASIAKKKGHSFGLWWFYGWMLFIVAIIHVQFIEDENAPKTPYIGAGSVPYMPPVQANGRSAADELKKYKELFDQGVLTEEEFKTKKEQLLKEEK